MIIQNSLHTTLLPESPINYRLILPSVCEKVCLWLHGYRECSTQILANSNLERLAKQHNLAILLPDVPDTYYLNQDWNNCYTEQFLISEFLPKVLAEYHLPQTKKDTCIAGISMGGFGALLLGSHFPHLFGKIICISGAFIIDDILIGNPEVIGSFNNLKHFQNIFGDIPSLDDSYERNPSIAALCALQEDKLPPIFMACGSEDLLYRRNVKLYRQLQALGTDITWWEDSGNHTWEFFNLALEDAFTKLK